MKQLYFIVFLSLSVFTLVAQQQPELKVSIGHQYYVPGAKFSPNGNMLMTTGERIKIWDVKTGKLLRDLKAENLFAHYAEFSPDGNKVLVAYSSSDSSIEIWDVNTGENLIKLKTKNDGHLVSAKFSPDGTKVALVSHYNRAEIWDITSGKVIVEIKESLSANYFEFSPDGKKILTTDYNSVKLLDASSGKLINTYKQDHEIRECKFNKTGQKIVVAFGYYGAKVLDCNTGTVNLDLTKYDVSYAEFSADGKKILLAADMATTKIVDANTGHLLFELGSRKSSFSRLAKFSPDNSTIVTLFKNYLISDSLYLSNPSLSIIGKVWDVNTGEVISNLLAKEGNVGNLDNVDFSFDGKKIVTVLEDTKVLVWDTQTGKLLSEMKGFVPGLTEFKMSPDGTMFITEAMDYSIEAKVYSINVYKINTAKPFLTISGHKERANLITFSPDSKKLIVAKSPSNTEIWDIAEKKKNVYFNKENKDIDEIKTEIEFSADGKKVVATAEDSTLRISDLISGKRLAVFKGVGKLFSSAKVSPDNRTVIALAEDNTIEVFDIIFNKHLFTIKKHNTYYIASAAEVFSPLGKSIAVAYKKSVIVYDIGTGKILQQYNDSESVVTKLIFSPDGSKIAIGYENGKVKAWDINSFRLLFSAMHDSEITSIKFSSDSKRLFNITESHNIYEWDISDGHLISKFINTDKESQELLFYPDGDKVMTIAYGNKIKIFNRKTNTLLYVFIQISGSDYLILDKDNHYDGTPEARKSLYFTCSNEVIELEQIKDQLWVPNLAERIMKGEAVSTKSLEELNMCGLVPEVEIIEDDKNNFHFKIDPRRGGLGETVLFVNDREFKRFQPRELGKTVTGYELVIPEVEIASYFLTDNYNAVKIKAYTESNTAASKGVEILVKSKDISNAAPNLYAVMIGISDYKGEKIDLQYASKDATEFSKIVAATARKMFNYDGKEHVFMYNFVTATERYQMPEKRAIHSLLQDIGKRIMPNDILLIFFAGHGTLLGEPNKKQFYFLTAEASEQNPEELIQEVAISMAELTEWIKPQNIKAQKRILIFDACFSGQAINDFVKVGSKEQRYVAARNSDNAELQKAIDKLNERSGLVILSAAGSKENAYEMSQYSHGVLTYSLLKTLEEQREVLSGSKYLSINRWFNAAKDRVTDLGKQNMSQQEAQVISTTDFSIGIVDAEVIAGIKLSAENFLFTFSSFQNADPNVVDDNLEMSKLINNRLETYNDDINSKITYTRASNSTEAYSLTGKYSLLKGNLLSVKVNLKQGNSSIAKYPINDKKDKLHDIVLRIINTALKVIKK